MSMNHTDIVFHFKVLYLFLHLPQLKLLRGGKEAPPVFYPDTQAGVY